MTLRTPVVDAPSANDSARRAGEVHHAIVEALLRTGAPPTRDELSEGAALSAEDVERALRELERAHGAVLHPGTTEPWVVHPFSLSPTATWVAKGSLGWWAPCVWCAFGICALARGRSRIHARLGGEAREVVVDVIDGRPASSSDLLIHFPIRARHAWRNVHHFCATVLPFDDETEIDAWCARHRSPRGQAVPLATVAELGVAWYGRHADRNWRKWTAREAQDIFRRVGLSDPFWDLAVLDDDPF